MSIWQVAVIVLWGMMMALLGVVIEKEKEEEESSDYWKRAAARLERYADYVDAQVVYRQAEYADLSKLVEEAAGEGDDLTTE